MMQVERSGPGTGYRYNDVYSEVGVSDKELDRYTVYCALPGTPHGHYDEEIDVDARSGLHALQIAEAAIELDYSPRLRPVLTEKRVTGTWNL